GCRDGVCLSPSNNSTKFCSDSDGLNYYNKGYVVDGVTNYTDLCLGQGMDNNRVFEYSCFDGKVHASEYLCPKGCSDGVCVNIPTGLCGDADLNSEINAIDITKLSDYAFGGVEIPLGANVDLNGDGVVDIRDVTILTNYVKRGGPKPTCEKESVKVFSGTSWLHNSYNDSMTCQELCGKSGSEVVVNGCYDRNLEKCTVAVGTICMSGESKIILHRTTKNCSDDSLIVDKDGKTEQIFPVGGGTGYWNYKCESRKQEHCYDDGSFDTYYDEVCEYSSDEYLFNDGDLDYEVGKDYATACCCKGNNFNGCTSTDGVNPFIKGKTTSKEGVVYEDKCDGMKVIDYFCDAWGQVTNINDVVCLDGCNDGACKKVEVTPNPETGPIELPDSIYDEEGVSYDCSGCVEEKKCYPFGYRKNGYYCSDENYLFIRQKTGSTEDCVPGAENECQDELFCENNFECKTNVCANGQCITQGFLKKILDWFGRMFGG
ncbi:MAG TPA: dockerin type I repeat-containing protein, partial [Candidatus Nanoarchaeia archaeon]|nr:dockerin type I repeat-containing protein [Candidatus Nanoarchaeia archaeon]